MQWPQVCALALKLPEVEESTSYGRPALKVKGKGICFSNNPEDVVFQLENVDEQQFLLETQPDVYYITDHYIGWPAIRARLKKLTAAECDLRLKRAWFIKAPKAVQKKHAGDASLALNAAPVKKAAKKAPAKKAAPKKSPVKKKTAAKKKR